MVTTYLSRIVESFAGLAEPINAALAAAELPRLVDWFAGQPSDLREQDTPYAWFDFPDVDDVEGGGQGNTGERFAVPFAVGLVIGAGSPAELLDLGARVIPVVQAAIETAGVPGFYLESAGVSPGPTANRVGLVRLWLLPFLVFGSRATGSAV